LAEAADHLFEVEWDVEASSGYVSGGVEAEVIEPTLKSVDVDGDSLYAWTFPPSNTLAIVEATVTAVVNLEVEATFFAYDSADRSTDSIGTDRLKERVEVELNALISVTGPLTADVPEWTVEIAFAHDTLRVDLGDIEPDGWGYEE
jgi:hypothetical protein